jgi:hypothetical protein
MPKYDVIVNGVRCQWEGKSGNIGVPPDRFTTCNGADYQAIASCAENVIRYLTLEGFLDKSGGIMWNTYTLKAIPEEDKS